MLISDLTKFFLLFKKDGKRFDVNKFLDILLEIITDEGTLIIPTHNWEFCSSKYFNYHETPSMTGSLGKIALNRKDFKRTKNPIAKILRYFKPQTYRNKKAYTRKGRDAARENKLLSRGD